MPTHFCNECNTTHHPDDGCTPRYMGPHEAESEKLLAKVKDIMTCDRPANEPWRIIDELNDLLFKGDGSTDTALAENEEAPGRRLIARVKGWMSQTDNKNSPWMDVAQSGVMSLDIWNEPDLPTGEDGDTEPTTDIPVTVEVYADSGEGVE